MRTPVDRLIVRLEGAFEDTVTTESGVTLYKDTTTNPEWHVTVTGEVVAVPDKLSRKMENRGRIMEARVGDTAILSYQVVFDMEVRDRNTPVHANQFFHDGGFLWKVEYFQVLGFIREGNIVPASGYVFCEAVVEEKSERVGLIWVPEMSRKEKPKGRARVVAVGANRTTESKLSISQGDTVIYRDAMAEKYEVAGKHYIVLQQCYILGKEN